MKVRWLWFTNELWFTNDKDGGAGKIANAAPGATAGKIAT
jgi:hypothetical protein